MSNNHQRLRNEVTLTLNQGDPLTEDIISLLADRDALVDQCEKLRKALRAQVIYGKRQTLPNTHIACGMCEEEWEIGRPERHAEGCLAA